MAAPILRPLNVTRTANGRTAASFVVVRAGSYLGEGYGVGDVLVCEGEAKHGDAVVLVARGHGRPRMGQVRGRQLLGDAGERCHEARWQPAGRLVAIVRDLAPPASEVVQLVSPRASAPIRAQLSLFAVEAA